MKKFILLLLVCVNMNAFSQSIFPYEKVTYFQKGNKKSTDNLFKEKGVKEEQEFIQKNTKKAEKLAWTRTYNTAGNNVSYKSTKNKYNHIYYWKNDSQLSSSITFRKLDTSWYWVYEYTSDNRLVEYRSYDKNKPVCIWKTAFEYNATGAKTKETVYGKKGKLSSKIEYDYFEDGQKKETRIFDKKGKLKKVYKYTCNPKGDLDKEDKLEQLNYCVIKNKNEDGSFYEILETHVDGKIKRQIYTYSADSNMIKYEAFKPSGQVRYTTKYSYNAEGKTTAYEFYKGNGKLKYSEKYAFNEKGLLINEDRFNNKNKLVFRTRYAYTYF